MLLCACPPPKGVPCRVPPPPRFPRSDEQARGRQCKESTKPSSTLWVRHMLFCTALWWLTLLHHLSTWGLQLTHLHLPFGSKISGTLYTGRQLVCQGMGVGLRREGVSDGRGFGGGSCATGGRDALEGEGPQRLSQRRLDRRLEEVTKAVGGRLRSVTNAFEAGTWHWGDSGWT